MRWVGVLPFALALTVTSVFAQATFQLPREMAPGACPVGLKVTHGAGLPVSMAADNTNSRPAQSQGIHMVLTNPGSLDIAGMEITVHGLSGKWRAVPTANPSTGSEVAKTVKLSLDVKHNGYGIRDLSFSHFSAVTSVDVNVIEYSDGSRWMAPSAAACSVTPDLIMLVAAQ